MKVLLIGATGLTGNLCLARLLADPVISFVEIWSRRNVEVSNPKLTQKIIDFNNILTSDVNGFDAFICCLGTTIKKAGSQSRFRETDFDYVVNFAKLASKNKVNKLIIVSSTGANASSKNFYLRTKGEMESAVLSEEIPTIIILRPSLLLGNRKEFRFGEKLAQYLMKALSFLFIGKLKRIKGIEAESVAKAIVKLTKDETKGKIIIESEQILAFVE